MKVAALLLLMSATGASAQDTSFSALRFRGAIFRMPEIGHVRDDWRAGTGAHVAIASNVGRSELGLSVGRMDFDPTTGKPSFTETLISLGWLHAIARAGAVELGAGAQLTDVRMHFDDPAMVAGLRNEEEQLLSAVGRARLFTGWRYSAFVEATYGLLMTSTRTPTATVILGVQRDGRMPGWLRNFLR